MGYQVVDAAFVEANLGKLPLIDVRTPAEYAQGRIPGAVCVDFFAAQAAGPGAASELARRVQAAGVRPDDECIVYCQVGARAQEACKQLAACGYSSLDCYVGSYADWVSDPTRPIER